MNELEKAQEVKKNGHGREKLMKALEEERKMRQSECVKEIQEILKRHRCAIQAFPVLRPCPGGGYSIDAQPSITPME